jgi:hypothetical protein
MVVRHVTAKNNLTIYHNIYPLERYVPSEVIFRRDVFFVGGSRLRYTADL